MEKEPLYTVNAVAPSRINDLGGWCDIKSVGQGSVLNFAIWPGVEVQIKVYNRVEKEPLFVLNLESLGESYVWSGRKNKKNSRHPLIEAAINMLELPKNYSYMVNIYSKIPAGASTGTSASVSVALIGALLYVKNLLLNKKERLNQKIVAQLAHRLETEKLKWLAGVQDQYAASCGGINYLHIVNYPTTTVKKIILPEDLLMELENRLILIFLGENHVSSEVHRMVIEHIKEKKQILDQLSACAEKALTLMNEALNKNTWGVFFKSLGQLMTTNNELQRELHQKIIPQIADEISNISNKYGALGCKVNGAGVKGTVTILSGPDMAQERQMIAEIEQLDSKIKNIPITIDRRGLRVWETK